MIQGKYQHGHHVVSLDCRGSLLFCEHTGFSMHQLYAAKSMAQVLGIPMMRVLKESITLEMKMRAAGLHAKPRDRRYRAISFNRLCLGAL